MESSKSMSQSEIDARYWTYKGKPMAYRGKPVEKHGDTWRSERPKPSVLNAKWGIRLALPSGRSLVYESLNAAVKAVNVMLEVVGSEKRTSEEELMLILHFSQEGVLTGRPNLSKIDTRLYVNISETDLKCNSEHKVLSLKDGYEPVLFVSFADGSHEIVDAYQFGQQKTKK